MSKVKWLIYETKYENEMIRYGL